MIHKKELRQSLRQVRRPQSTPAKRGKFYSTIQGMANMDDDTKKMFIDAYDKRMKDSKKKITKTKEASNGN